MKKGGFFGGLVVLTSTLTVALLAVSYGSWWGAGALRNQLGCSGNPCVITHSEGGIEVAFIFNAYMSLLTGQRFVVDGRCRSSCVSLIAHARGNVCITRRSAIEVHTIRDRRTYKSYGMDQRLPPDISRFIYEKYGGYPEDGFVTFTYGDARRFWRACRQSDWAQAH